MAIFKEQFNHFDHVLAVSVIQKSISHSRSRRIIVGKTDSVLVDFTCSTLQNH